MDDRKDQFRVINGNLDKGLSRMTEFLIKSCMPPGRELVMQSSFHGEELLQFAQRNETDLFMFWFNNISCSHDDPRLTNSKVQIPDTFPPDVVRRFGGVLHLISHIRETYQKPIFVISGNEGDPPLTAYIEEVSDLFVHHSFEFEDVQPKIRNLFGWKEKS